MSIKKENVPIFTVGKFRDIEFKPEDLKKIEENFRKFYPKIQPVVKLSHGEEQIFLQSLAKKLGFDVKKLKDIKGERLIGLGSIANVRFDEKNGQLLADIVDIPEDFAEYVNSTPTRRISPEFYKTNEGFVLRAIALVNIPENKNLDKIVFDENDKMEIINITKIKEDVQMEKDILKLKEQIMELENKLKNANETIQEKENVLKEQEETIIKLKEEIKKIKIERKVDELINNGHIAPAKRELAVKALELAKFDENGEENPIIELLASFKEVDTNTYTDVNKAEKKDEKKKEEEEDKILLQKYEELVKEGYSEEEATKIVYGKLLK